MRLRSWRSPRPRVTRGPSSALSGPSARALGVSLNRLKYWIGRFLALELIRVSSFSGLKRYRAAADAFFVPFEATTAEALFEP